MNEPFDPYHKWLGIPPAEQPPNHYQLLGVAAFEDDPDVIDIAADRQMMMVRTFQTGKHGKLSQQILNEISAARVCLVDPQSKAKYDASLRAKLDHKEPPLPKNVPVAPPLPDSSAVGIGDDPAEATAGGSSSSVLSDIGIKPQPSPSTVFRAGRRRRKKNAVVITIGACIAVVALLVVLSIGSRSDTEDKLSGEEAEVASEAAAKVETPNQDQSIPGPDDKPNDHQKVPDSDSTPEVEDDQPADESDTTSQATEESSGQGDTTDIPAESATDLPAESSGTNDLLSPPEEPQETQRLAVPARDRQKAVMSEVAELYELSDLDSAEDKLKIARELLVAADDPSAAPVEQFALLRTVMNLAMEAGDPEMLLGAADQIAERFQVDPVEGKAFALTQFASQAKTPKAITGLIEQAQPVIEDAITADRYDIAMSVVESAYKATSSGVAGAQLRMFVADGRKRMQPKFRQWQQVQAALKQLKTAPDDPELNELAGRWYCLERGQWDEGLPYLTKALDAQIVQAATSDLAEPEEPDAQLAVADAWYAIGQKEDDKLFLARASYWYQVCYPNLPRLQQARAEKRIGEIVEIASVNELIKRSPEPPSSALKLVLDRKYNQFHWKKGMQPVKLIHNQEGFIYLTSVSGAFQGTGEKFTLELGKDEYWYLHGTCLQPSLDAGATSFESEKRRLFQPAVKFYRWKRGQPPVRMIHKDAGFCCLAGMGGSFQNPVDNVSITIGPDGFWYLGGQCKSKTPFAIAISYTAERRSQYKVEMQQYVWQTGDAPKKMIAADAGFCYLNGIGGNFDGAGERVKIEIGIDNHWYLSGQAGRGFSGKRKTVRASAVAIRLLDS